MARPLKNMQNLVIYLIPTPLSNSEQEWLLKDDLKIIQQLKYFIVENEKTARKHLKQLGIKTPLREVQMLVLDQNTQLDEVLFEQFLKSGQQIGLMSEAGCPAVADPGAWVVRLAHRLDFKVHPFIGPSSILLALMASGANGQAFAFKGYLPKHASDRTVIINEVVKRLERNQETQIFIETPYRNRALFEALLQTVPKHIVLTLAINLTDPIKEQIQSRTIGAWQDDAKNLELEKQPAIFILG